MASLGKCTAILLALSAAFIGHATVARGQSNPPVSQGPKIALVLAGGGAKGIAHVGVIKVLEEAGVRPDLIVGTSMGAIIGGLYASGRSSKELVQIVESVDWDSIFIDDTPRQELTPRRKTDDFGFLADPRLRLKDGEPRLPLGAFKGQKLTLELRRLTQSTAGIRDFDRLPIPFRAVAADLETGEEVVLGSGDLARALRASMSIPAAFPPVEIGGRTLIDGGVVNNIPVTVARRLGARIIIVATFAEKLKPAKDLTSAISVLNQSIDLMMLNGRRQQLASLTPKDVLITIDTGAIGVSSFEEAANTIPIGEAAARIHFRKLSGLSNPKARQRDIRVPEVWGRPIGQIVIENNSPLSNGVLRKRMTLKEGDTLDRKQLESDIRRIYGLGLFQTVNYDLTRQDNSVVLRIVARENTAGKDYLRFGLQLENNFRGDSNYNFSTSYTRSAVNELNGEWRTQAILGNTLSLRTEFYQPLDEAGRFFVAPLGLIRDRDFNIFEDGDRVAVARVAEGIVAFRAGINLSDDIALSGILTRGIGNQREVTGEGNTPEGSFDTGTVGGGLEFDTIDSLKFPRDGELVFAGYSWSTEALGADRDFQSLVFTGDLARSWGDHTVVAGLTTNLTLDGEPGTTDLFSLGGPFRLSGFVSRALTSNNALLTRAIYYNRLGSFGPSFLEVPVYLGLSLEYGNVFEELDDINFKDMLLGGSVFLGVDTFFGPIYLGYGHTESNNNTVYLFVGGFF